MAGPKTHVAQQGECMSSIAFAHGFFWETLWSAPENAALKESRESPFVLRPGDAVHIPDLRPRQVAAATGARHVFRRKAVPAVLRLRLLDQDKPLAGLAYVLAYAGREITGTTDAEGKLEVYVPPDMPAATLRVGEGDEEYVYELAPRTLNPWRDVDGIQARLSNLGYYRGPINGQLDAATVAAIEQFQRQRSIEVTGQADETTTAALMDAHTGSGG
jgi:hypothetical protein